MITGSDLMDARMPEAANDDFAVPILIRLSESQKEECRQIIANPDSTQHTVRNAQFLLDMQR